MSGCVSRGTYTPSSECSRHPKLYDSWCETRPGGSAHRRSLQAPLPPRTAPLGHSQVPSSSPWMRNCAMATSGVRPQEGLEELHPVWVPTHYLLKTWDRSPRVPTWMDITHVFGRYIYQSPFVCSGFLGLAPLSPAHDAGRQNVSRSKMEPLQF